MAKRPTRPKKQPTGDHQIGYCRPPKYGQTKKGEVRNPWGAKGKPKPAVIDGFELAASQMVPVIIDGVSQMVPAETASHFVNMNAALAGDRGAYKEVTAQRRLRQKNAPSASEALSPEMQQAQQMVIRLARSAIQLQGNLKQLQLEDFLVTDDDGGFHIANWVFTAVDQYRERQSENASSAGDVSEEGSRARVWPPTPWNLKS